uniref:Cation channel sperm associated auxiliary subunit gamma n=1 Tax=Equus caballus TaxID=9796 RepID=A0A9L0TU58_HORSE
MFPTGPAWPRLRVLRALWALLAVLWAPWRLLAMHEIHTCNWQVVLNQFTTVGKEGESDRFSDQEPLDTVDSMFSQLVDAPINRDEKYLGFPYYLKINYTCKGKSPVNFHHWKIEQLQIQMEAAPFPNKGGPGGTLRGRSLAEVLGDCWGPQQGP